MKQPTNQYFWRSIMLLTVHILHVTSVASGTNTLSADTSQNKTYKDHYRNIDQILTRTIISKKQKLLSGHNISMALSSVEVIPHGNKREPNDQEDANQSYGKSEYDTKYNNYPYVFEKNTASHTTAKSHDAQQNNQDAESLLLTGPKNQPLESSNHQKVFKNTRKPRVIGTGISRQFKARLTRSAQEENVPPSNEDGNIPKPDFRTGTDTEAVTELSNRESKISSSEDNISTTTPQYEPASINSIYEHDFNKEITTGLSNIIPRDPAIGDIHPAPPLPKLTNETGFQSSMKESATSFQADSNKIEDSPTITTQSSPDSNLNQSIIESFQTSDFHQTAFTKIKLPSQDNTNFHADDVPPYAGDTGEIVRKLSEGPQNNQMPEARESYDDIFLEISLSSSGDSLLVNWLFESNTTQVSGFQVSYRMDNREDFDSSSLDISVRSFALHSLHEDENYVICVHAVVNNTAVRSSCAAWSKSSMKMVVGILAGTIFLIPCIIVMALILYKDHKMKQKNRLQAVDEDTSTGNQQLISCKNTPRIQLHSYHDEVKGDKANGNTCPTQASMAYSQKSLTKSTQDTGHENPYEHAADDSTDDDGCGPWQRLSKQDADMVSIPLHDELLSNSPAASISSKNNITYIMIRRNSGASNDRTVHQDNIHTENLSPSQDSIRL